MIDNLDFVIIKLKKDYIFYKMKFLNIFLIGIFNFFLNNIFYFINIFKYIW